MLVDDVQARLADMVSSLRNVGTAVDMMALIRTNNLPQFTPAAHVVPVGLRGGSEDAMAGAYIQSAEETVGVVLTFRNSDPEGARQLGRAMAIRDEVIEALVGWAPDEAMAGFRLVRGAVVQMEGTTLVYLLEFAIPLQLRILS